MSTPIKNQLQAPAKRSLPKPPGCRSAHCIFRGGLSFFRIEPARIQVAPVARRGGWFPLDGSGAGACSADSQSLVRAFISGLFSAPRGKK